MWHKVQQRLSFTVRLMSETAIYDVVKLFADTLATALMTIYESGGNFGMALLILFGLVKLCGRLASEMVEAVIALVMVPIALVAVGVEKYLQNTNKVKEK